MSLRSDNFDSVGELYTKDDLGELVVTIETAPGFFSGLGKLEDHGERCLVGKTSVCTECMARPRSASGFLRVSLDQSAVVSPAREHSLWP